MSSGTSQYAQTRKYRANISSEFFRNIYLYPRELVQFGNVFNRKFVFLFGFFLQCNVITNSIGLRFLHITDAIVIVCAPIFIINYYKIFKSPVVFLLYAVLTVVFILCWLLSYERGDGEFYNTAFAFIYVLFLLPFYFMILRQNLLNLFCWGILVGFAAASFLLFLDIVHHETLVRLGLSYVFDEQAALEAAARGDIVSLLRIEKAGGIWAAGNEAGPVFALAAAAAAHLAHNYRSFLIYVSFMLLFVATFTQTLNRSSFVAVVGVGLVLYLRNLSRRILIKSVAYSVLGAIALGTLLPFGLYEAIEPAFSKRFAEDSNINNNVSERLQTLSDGVYIALQYPFGIGTEARFSLMRSINGKSTPHNGFVATAYVSGIMFSLVVIMSTIYAILKPKTIGFIRYSAVAITSGYLFEEVNSNPAMMATVGIIIANVVLDVDFRLYKIRALRGRLSHRNR